MGVPATIATSSVYTNKTIAKGGNSTFLELLPQGVTPEKKRNAIKFGSHDRTTLSRFRMAINLMRLQIN